MEKKEVGLENSVNGKSDSSWIIHVEEFKNENPCTGEQREAIKQKALSDGCIVNTLIVSKSTKQLVWGYEELAIAKEYKLPYEVKELEFESKADCLAWIAEKRLATPCTNMFQKIEIGGRWWEYWCERDEAKNGEKALLKKVAREKCGRADKSAVIAIKAGTSHNTVNKVNRILESGNEEIIKACRANEMSISKADETINGGNSEEDKGGSNSQDETPEKEVLKAKKEKRRKIKQKEVDALAKYSINGFTSKKVKLDEKGLKFFVLRWNDEHPDNRIKEKDVQKAIDSFAKDQE